MKYLARTIPNAGFAHQIGVSHYAPLLRPELFNHAVLEFLEKFSAYINAANPCV